MYVCKWRPGGMPYGTPYPSAPIHVAIYVNMYVYESMYGHGRTYSHAYTNTCVTGSG